MAQKAVVELVDDLDGGPADETVAFALDGVAMVIDLSSENATKLRETLAEFVGHAKRTGGRKQRKQAAVGASAKSNGASGATNGKPDTQAIRDWARQQGETVADRGRIPQALVVRFQEAHPN